MALRLQTEVIKRFLKKKKISVTELAEQLSVSRCTVSRILNDRLTPSAEFIVYLIFISDGELTIYDLYKKEDVGCSNIA